MDKNLCESCLHSRQSEIFLGATDGEEIFNIFCDAKYRHGVVSIAVPPHRKCPKYLPADRIKIKSGKYSR